MVHIYVCMVWAHATQRITNKVGLSSRRPELNVRSSRDTIIEQNCIEKICKSIAYSYALYHLAAHITEIARGSV